jgi:acylglycerol lipase
VHGFGECSDGFLESAYNYALNGIAAHLIDLDGFGFSGGSRIERLYIDVMHFNIIAMMAQFEEDLPTFLYGNSMGCMVINTFLLRNPELKLSGVIFSSPFFGLAEHLGIDRAKCIAMSAVEPLLEVSAI